MYFADTTGYTYFDKSSAMAKEEIYLDTLEAEHLYNNLLILVHDVLKLTHKEGETVFKSTSNGSRSRCAHFLEYAYKQEVFVSEGYEHVHWLVISIRDLGI